MREIDKAVELLRPLLEGLAKDRDRMVDIYSVCIGEDFIVVAIDNVRYQINVTGKSVRSIVRSVVNYVALKFQKMQISRNKENRQCYKLVAFIPQASLWDESHVLSLGGDTDTLTAIAGSMAEAFYGVPDMLKKECRNRITNDMRCILETAEGNK